MWFLHVLPRRLGTTCPPGIKKRKIRVRSFRPCIRTGRRIQEFDINCGARRRWAAEQAEKGFRYVVRHDWFPDGLEDEGDCLDLVDGDIIFVPESEARDMAQWWYDWSPALCRFGVFSTDLCAQRGGGARSE